VTWPREESHSRLSALLAEALEAVFIKDLAGRYLYVNPAAARLLGRSPEEVIGKKDAELLPADDQPWSRLSQGVFRNVDGEVTGLFGICGDPGGGQEVEREVARFVTEVETPQEAALVLRPLDLSLSAAFMARRREMQEARA